VAYPATLVGIGSRDARTDPMHARKMVAALQHATVGDGPILLSVRRESGHGVEMAKTRAMNEVADRYAFLMWQLGVVE
jgi:prolyl oligopeptidase